MTECKVWLKVQGLNSTGNVQELKLEISNYMIRCEGCPKIMETKKCSVSDVKYLIGSLLSCISKVMIRNVTEKES